MRLTDGWSHVKRGGLAALPGGQLSEEAHQLIEELAGLQIFVVPVGTLERWVTTEGGHGPAWVSNVLDAGAHTEPGLAARGFVQRIASSFESYSGHAIGNHRAKMDTHGDRRALSRQRGDGCCQLGMRVGPTTL